MAGLKRLATRTTDGGPGLSHETDDKRDAPSKDVLQALEAAHLRIVLKSRRDSIDDRQEETIDTKARVEEAMPGMFEKLGATGRFDEKDFRSMVEAVVAEDDEDKRAGLVKQLVSRYQPIIDELFREHV